MNVNEVVAAMVAAQGVRRAFGVLGSGNFRVSNALAQHGVEFVLARHEQGATTMADAFARMSGELGVVTVHQGCGLSNAITGLGEAAKSRTPLLVIAAEAVTNSSNFFVDQAAMAASVGALSFRVTSAEHAVTQVREALRACILGRRTVVLNLPIDVTEAEVAQEPTLERIVVPSPPSATVEDVQAIADALREARRPVFIAGRGAREGDGAGAVRRLAGSAGALLSAGAVAKGMFSDDPWDIDVVGGFSSPLTAELINEADVVVAWGISLNMWTSRHGHLFGPDTRVIQVDTEVTALGGNDRVDVGVVGGVEQTADAVAQLLAQSPRADAGYRTEEVAARLSRELRWNDVEPGRGEIDNRVDPRSLSVAVDTALPANRVLSIDSGNFMGYPTMYLSVPDHHGYCMTQSFQSIGLGLATAIGAALAQPERTPVLAAGDGGFLMGIAELETAVRLELGMIIVIYNDHVYGAEVHHFGPQGDDTALVEFPETDFAAMARGFGCEAVTVRTQEDLDALSQLQLEGRTTPLLIDAKLADVGGSWWLQFAYGH